MSIFAWLSLLVTVLLALFAGYEIGKAVLGGATDWSFLISSMVAALLVYTVAFTEHAKARRRARAGNSGS